jgi:hypothetical protein
MSDDEGHQRLLFPKCCRICGLIPVLMVVFSNLLFQPFNMLTVQQEVIPWRGDGVCCLRTSLHILLHILFCTQTWNTTLLPVVHSSRPLLSTICIPLSSCALSIYLFSLLLYFRLSWYIYKHSAPPSFEVPLSTFHCFVIHRSPLCINIFWLRRALFTPWCWHYFFVIPL